MANISYYQGMNYIAYHYLHVFEEDEEKTFFFLRGLFKKHFVQYTQYDFDKMKVIFYQIKSFLRHHFPDLNAYFNQIKLDTDVIFASWCLTLFTLITQYHKDCRYLDEINDIFLSEGWRGLIKVIMVLIERTERFLMNKSYEDCLIFLSDIVKNNFSFLSEEKEFSFKQEVGKYPQVNRENMKSLKQQYEVMFSKQEEFWKFFDELQKSQQSK